MPTLNHQFLDQDSQGNVIPNPQGLVADGPSLAIRITLPQSLEDFLTKSGMPIPSPVDGVALVDTGATYSALDEDVARQLGLQPVGTIDTLTAAGKRTCSQFHARIFFPGSPLPDVEAGRLTGVDLGGQTAPVQNKPILALLGRDLLSRFVFVYNGVLGQFSLSL